MRTETMYQLLVTATGEDEASSESFGEDSLAIAVRSGLRAFSEEVERVCNTDFGAHVTVEMALTAPTDEELQLDETVQDS